MSEEAKPNVSKDILQRLNDLDDLPHFPEALVKLEKAIATDETIKLQEVVNLVVQDPRLVTGIIDMSNSARYSMGTHVTDISEAVSRLGFQEVRLMAHTINYNASIKRKPPFSDKHFLKHALLSAVIAQKVAAQVGLDVGQAFLAALMRDIGIYLLATEDRDKYLEVIKLTDYNIAKLPIVENKIYNTYHALMSARLLQQWKFPNEIIMGVAFHHNPEKADPKFQAFAYLTYLAEQGAFRLGYDNGIADITESEREKPSANLARALKYFELELEVFDTLLQQADKEAESMGM